MGARYSISIYAVVMLANMALVGAAHSQSCPTGEKRLQEGEPCIPKKLFNYLYCLKNSGGGKVEITQKSGDEDSQTVEVQVSGKGSGVVLKGEAGGGFKKSDLTKATKELQEKLDTNLAKICTTFADSIIQGKEPPQMPAAREKKVESKPAYPDPRGAFAGFSCDVNSYGHGWAEQNRERISNDLYGLYGCSAPPSAHMKPGFNSDFHTPADSSGPWTGFAARSTVLYYHSENKQIAEALARDLTKRYGHQFAASKGGGLGVLPEWYKRTIIVHLREDGT